MQQAELDLREIFQILRRRLWILLLMPIVAAVTAGILSVYVLQPVYSASTTLWVVKSGGSGQISYDNLLTNRNLTKTYAEVAKSRAVMKDVMDKLQLKGVAIDKLQRKLTVNPVRDTEILSFTIEDNDPVMAAKLADAVAAAFQGQITNYMKVDNVAVVDAAIVPTNPIKPRPLLNVALGFVLGGMAAVGLVFLLEYLDTSIKSPEDVARHFGLPVLGIIPVIEGQGAEVSHRLNKARARNTSAVVEK